MPARDVAGSRVARPCGGALGRRAAEVVVDPHLVADNPAHVVSTRGVGVEHKVLCLRGRWGARGRRHHHAGGGWRSRARPACRLLGDAQGGALSVPMADWRTRLAGGHVWLADTFGWWTRLAAAWLCSGMVAAAAAAGAAAAHLLLDGLDGAGSRAKSGELDKAKHGGGCEEKRDEGGEGVADRLVVRVRLLVIVENNRKGSSGSTRPQRKL